MRLRNILLIHGRMFTNILKHLILSELSDVAVIESQSIEDGWSICKQKQIDVVICGKEIAMTKNPQSLSIMQEMRRNTGVIIITATGTEKNIQEIHDAGFEYHLVSPLPADAIAAKINAACKPRKWREQKRVHTPEVKAVLEFGSHAVEATVINISLDGILCDLTYETDYEIFNTANITIAFSDKYDNIKIKKIQSKILRMNVLGWKDVNTPDLIRTAWNLVEFAPGQKEMLHGVLDRIAKDIARLSNAGMNKEKPPKTH